MNRATRGGVNATLIKSHRFAPSFEIHQQSVFSLNNIELVVVPTQLPLEAVANSPQAGRFLAHQHRATMTYLAKKRCFPYSFNANEQNMLPLCTKNQEIFEQRLPAEECKAFVH
jgi:hypothetical protein